ncbi:MAG: DUF4040 domain-containing protein [Oscillospiraceae bacterium]|nr:DUF4040 domain-containing protein [Oscillospiraceae bacterium]
MLVFWILTALLIVKERRAIRIILYFGAFSFITAICFFLLGSPDVAMAEAAISTFATIFFVICVEKYTNLQIDEAEKASDRQEDKKPLTYHLKKFLPPLGFTVFLCALFIHFLPDNTVNTFLKDQYVERFAFDVGGENAVTAIYLGYRVYDTLFEALILVITVVAVSHMSWFDKTSVADGRRSDIQRSGMAVFTIRIIAPILLLFGVYLIMNGHISPGGGFQGGVAIASFFICRYMIYNIYDISIDKIIRAEKAVFVVAALIAVAAIFLGVWARVPAAYLDLYQGTYLLIMNALIGVKVACTFIVLFYRFVAIERL